MILVTIEERHLRALVDAITHYMGGIDVEATTRITALKAALEAAEEALDDAQEETGTE